MEKIAFYDESEGREAFFYVLEQTKLAGDEFLLVTDDDSGEGECYVMKKVKSEEGEKQQEFYEIVEDEDKLEDLGKIFEQLMDDTTIVR